ncbi:thioredoxin-like protein [Acrodontium crateriforme]|uniref:Thioredoxin-like protein n=1 Tax=Acrodontium crateriforme TaxID=150365 RepID=A0AAQ3R6S9_9PEZI|nr:thioredoxin-like protein [Acrodontium crateriforme]
MEELANKTAYLKAVMYSGVTVLEGTTTWCPQCKAIQPFVDKMMKKYPDAKFYKYDVDAADDIAQELGARAVPSFNVFKDGDIVDGVSWNKPTELEKAIQESYGDGKVVEE